jgi:hypothetical protein
MGVFDIDFNLASIGVDATLPLRDVARWLR